MDGSDEVEIELTDRADEALLQRVKAGLGEDVPADVPLDSRPLNIAARDSAGHLIGGLTGDTAWGWLHVRRLWITAAWRGRGLGRELMGRAEREALRRGCHGAHLSTISFQARPFYEKLGYTVFGTLENYPPGYERHFMRKSLQP